MADYLLIESRDPFAWRDVDTYYDLATELRNQGNDVVLFLVENGVLPARRGACSERLAAAANAGVVVLADDFSLRERGITLDHLVDQVRASPLDVVIDELASGAKTLWH